MRITPSILCLLALAGTVSAAETYRWVDKDGVHYSDQPHPGAEKMNLPTAPPPGSVAPPVAPPSPSTTPPKPFVYASCAVVSPSPDQVFNNVHSVNVSLNLEPSLQVNHTIVVRVNGSRVASWPATSTSSIVQDLSRGTFSVTAQVLNEQGDVLCNSDTLMFHIRQPSMLTPGARAAPKS